MFGYKKLPRIREESVVGINLLLIRTVPLRRIARKSDGTLRLRSKRRRGLILNS